MSTPNGCPCDAVETIKEDVRELKAVVDKHDRRLSQGETQFALISKDIEFIKLAVTKKSKFNADVISAIVQSLVSILLGFIAVKIGLQ